MIFFSSEKNGGARGNKKSYRMILFLFLCLLYIIITFITTTIPTADLYSLVADNILLILPHSLFFPLPASAEILD